MFWIILGFIFLMTGVFLAQSSLRYFPMIGIEDILAPIFGVIGIILIGYGSGFFQSLFECLKEFDWSTFFSPISY